MFGWKAAGLSCCENLGSDPCNNASLIANSTPIESNTRENLRANWYVSSLHRTSTIVRLSDGQLLYTSNIKLINNTVMPVSFANILSPPRIVLSSTEVLSGSSIWLFFYCVCLSNYIKKSVMKEKLKIFFNIYSQIIAWWNFMYSIFYSWMYRKTTTRQVKHGIFIVK